MENIVKIGSVKLTESEARRYYFDEKKRYIIAYRRVYALEWCNNYINSDGSRGGVYGHEIYYHEGDLPLVKRGRFMAATAETVNRLCGYNLVRCSL